MSNEREKVRMQHRGRGPMGRGMQPGEKPKDLKSSLGKLLSYIGNFKAAIIVVMIFAAASTVFNVIGPKTLARLPGCDHQKCQEQQNGKKRHLKGRMSDRCTRL